MTRYRVFHLITRLLRGGAEAKTLAEIAALKDRYEFTLGYGAEFSPGQLRQVAELDISTRCFGLIRHYDPASLALASLQVYHYFKTERFDIVHTHETEAGIVGRIAARWASVPTSFTRSMGCPLRSSVTPCYGTSCASWND